MASHELKFIQITIYVIITEDMVDFDHRIRSNKCFLKIMSCSVAKDDSKRYMMRQLDNDVAV